MNISNLFTRKIFFFALSLAVSAGVLFYLRQHVSLGELLAFVRQIPAAGLAVFVIFSLTMSCFRCWRYLILLRAAGFQAARLPMFLITLARNLFVDLLPARLGDLIFIYLAKNRLGVALSAATACFAWCFVFDFISLGFLIAVATLFAFGGAIHPAVMLAAGAFLVLLSTLLLRALPTLTRLVGRLAEKLPPPRRETLGKALAAFDADLVKLQTSGLYWPVLALSLGVRLGKYLTLYSLLVTLVLPLGYTIFDFPPAKVFFGLVAAESAASLPIAGIAGFGAYEGAWSLVFTFLGYPEKVAALTGVSHHLLTQVYGYALGALAFLLLLVPWPRPSQTACLAGRQEQAPAGTGRFFYGRLLLLIAVPLCLVALLFPRLPSTAAPSQAGNTGIDTGVNAGIHANAPAAPPAGQVVFQRADGIFVFDTATGVEKKMTASGRYPRWSPDGRHIAFRDGDGLWLMDADGANRKMLAQDQGLRALCFAGDFSNGGAILFSDGQGIKKLDPASGTVTVLYPEGKFLELDSSSDGAWLAVTERILGGYRVAVIDIKTASLRAVAGGCSASISADDRLISVNAGNHRRMYLYDRESLLPVETLSMVDGKKFDNQFFANQPDWLASRSENDEESVYLHHLPSGMGFRLPIPGGCDRPDFFIRP